MQYTRQQQALDHLPVSSTGFIGRIHGLYSLGRILCRFFHSSGTQPKSGATQSPQSD
jgi:hypothetical protein